MRQSGIGCSDTTPAEVVAQTGNLPDHVKSGSSLVVAEEVADIFKDQSFRERVESHQETDNVIKDPTVIR
jgi:hypothetical protein